MMPNPQADSLEQAVARTGQNYDSVPYVSIPFQRLQPARLSANARLLGLPAPDVKRARTLDIGCASGGHIIPLAAMFPEAEFVGVDISAEQIADGQRRAARLGLGNVSLQACSLADIDASWGRFDYIICHGVYSWVPDLIREAILRVCGERLAHEGIAAISFNVLPGWRMFQVVRDSLILHAGDETDHTIRSALTRQLFELMARHSPEESTYGSIWRNEARHMVELPDSYLAHEIFEDDNAPSTFRSFTRAAAHHGLAYLSETRVHDNVPESSQEARGEIIRKLSGNELLATEQYIDIVTGRTFRESLLIRAERAPAVDRSFADERVCGLHFVSPKELRIGSPVDGAAFTLAAGDGDIATIDDPFTATALRALVMRQPGSSSLDDLAPPAMASSEQRAKLAAVLMQLVLHGSLDVSTEPVVCAHEAGAVPKAWPLIASDAAAGVERSATLRHAPFLITPSLRFLLPLLDGKHGRAEIVDTFVRFAQAGEIGVADERGSITDAEQLREVCTVNVNRQIDELARMGVLI